MAQEFVAERPNRAPTHPGAILREDVLPALSVSIKEFAAALGVSRQSLHRVLSEDADISTEMALRLGKVCGNGPHLWLRMQQARNLWLAQEKLTSEIDGLRTLGAT